MATDFRRFLGVLLSLFGMAVAASTANAGPLCVTGTHATPLLCQRLASEVPSPLELDRPSPLADPFAAVSWADRDADPIVLVGRERVAEPVREDTLRHALPASAVPEPD